MLRFSDLFTACGLFCLATSGCASELGVAGVDPALLADNVVVQTEHGLLRGVRSDGVLQFWRIPYAKPPLGELRWRAPQSPDAWSGVRDAREPGPRCAQNAAPEEELSASTEEDCLHLNVTAPLRDDDRLLPVMVWIHGGSYTSGSGVSHDPRRLAREGNVIVVTINYRLGALGFLGYPGLEGSGTFGLQDQQAALRWVRDNARAFHGDPHNVTVFGESAGGSSVCAHLAAASSGDLFDRAIVQSENCSTMPSASRYILLTASPEYETWKPLAWVESIGRDVATQLGCVEPSNALACLREVPVAKWLSVTTTVSSDYIAWSPAYQTELLPEHPGHAIAQGAFNKVPVLAGTTRDEGTVFAPGFAWLTREFYPEGLVRMFGDAAPEVAERYPVEPDETPAHTWSRVVTDVGFACSALHGERALAQHVPVYAYEFADRDAPSWFDFPADFPLGAFHGSELPYLIGVANKEIPLDPAQDALSSRMIGYWSRFAATGNPNAEDAATWKHLRAETPESWQVLALAPGESGVAPTDFATEHHCDLWWNMP